jgi:hypothetical protein
MAAFSLTTHVSYADTVDAASAFTKHGLPVPGTYFKNQEETPRTAMAVTKSGGSTTSPNPAVSKAAKKEAKHLRVTAS